MPGDSLYQWNYATQAGALTVSAGSHTIAVTATDDLGSATEQITFSVGSVPVNTSLTGTGTAKGATILTSPVTVGLSFSQPSTVAITSFPAITPQARSPWWATGFRPSPFSA